MIKAFGLFYRLKIMPTFFQFRVYNKNFSMECRNVTKTKADCLPLDPDICDGMELKVDSS